MKKYVMKQIRKVIGGAAIALFIAGVAGAAPVEVSDNIATSTMWTANKTYKLKKQIYVLPGATLTIEAGTVIASDPADLGSLAVARGAKIYVNGTKEKPVIMTSTTDVATWEIDAKHPTGHNPKTGTWHVGCNEWGNLTLMGKGLISASHYGGLQVGNNTKDPSGLNVKQMEGLTDLNYSMYGGANDNDDSGSISYVSLRYGGKVIGLGNELNGLSLGGIGRETDVNHVEIINNVDDGVEIWGGTVNLKYLSIWNVGDDSFDVDEGWRGKGQFFFIVQGYSVDAKQGSGVGDNCFETDGAEDSDAQPVTTSVIYNATVVGNPIDGDHATTWRDNARVQYRNCIFMDIGESVVKNDNTDGDGAHGYGYSGTLSFADTWTTDYWTTSLVNACIGCKLGDFNHAFNLYQALASGKLAEITDSVFFRNFHASAYTESNAVGVTVNGGSNAAKNNVVIAGYNAVNAPIVSITRGTLFTSTEGKGILPVVSINPLPANEAVVSVGKAPDDGFYTPAQYRGAFSATSNWLAGWTATDAYGMTEGGAGECNPESMSLSKTKVKIQVSGSDDITVTVVGADDCPSEGVTVKATISKADMNDIGISSKSKVTDANGEAVFTITGKKIGKAKVTFAAGTLKKALQVQIK